MSRKAITAQNSKSVGPYSHAVDCGGLIFLSGQTPLNPNTGKLVEGGITEQTRQCFDNLFNVLAAAQLSGDDVQKVNVFLTDMSDFAAMNDVYKTRFNEPYPARSAVAVAALPLGSKIEIELIASRK